MQIRRSPRPAITPLPPLGASSFLLILGLGMICLIAAHLGFTRFKVSASASTGPPVAAIAHPDAACAGCHRDIYDRYERTSMAMGSGLAREGVLEGGFRHKASGVTYKVFTRGGGLWMSFDRPSAAPGGTAPSAELHGERELFYFIGSGHRGRTYLYQVDGQWFELPINFYGKRQIWDMAPNMGSATHMPAPLPVDSNCLHCHATGVQTALPEAKNKYAGAPFEAGGVGCSGCHGDPSRHIAQRGQGPILNPDKLAPAERDDVCLQCHLEGDAVVYRPHRSLAEFQPGDHLNSDALYFVRASHEMEGRRATSQYEALLQSACKRASGDRLTCTTCHSPHDSPSPAQRVDFFRARCLTCHAGAGFALRHHPEQKSCAACHMPTLPASDISHEQVTDHNIQRLPPSSARALPSLEGGDDLRPVGKPSAGNRELGLAYAQMAARGDRQAGAKALTLLTKAEAEGASDAPLHSQLGYLSQISGKADRALDEYRMALKSDPYEPSALGNLAVLEASRGRVGDAITLLERLVNADPAQTAGGLNLAFIECNVGRKPQARDLLRRLLALSPDDPQARAFLRTGWYAGQHCSLQ